MASKCYTVNGLRYDKLTRLRKWVKKCPYCGSRDTKKKGLYKKQRQRYLCLSCGRQFQNRRGWITSSGKNTYITARQ